MIWTEQHNEMLIREMFLFEPRKYRKGSPQRGNVWEQISAFLNDLDDPKFDVTQKSVRDHYNLLEKQQKKRLRDEEKAKKRLLAFHQIIVNLKMLCKTSLSASWARMKKTRKKILKRKKMRQSAMESLAESKKRKGGYQGEKRKRKLSNGSDTIAY